MRNGKQADLQSADLRVRVSSSPPKDSKQKAGAVGRSGRRQRFDAERLLTALDICYSIYVGRSLTAEHRTVTA